MKARLLITATNFDSKSNNTTTAVWHNSTLLTWIAAVFIVAFLVWSFNTSIEDPHLLRTELGLMMIDEILSPALSKAW
jgi:hypothetical protein